MLGEHNRSTDGPTLAVSSKQFFGNDKGIDGLWALGSFQCSPGNTKEHLIRTTPIDGCYIASCSTYKRPNRT